MVHHRACTHVLRVKGSGLMPRMVQEIHIWMRQGKAQVLGATPTSDLSNAGNPSAQWSPFHPQPVSSPTGKRDVGRLKPHLTHRSTHRLLFLKCTASKPRLLSQACSNIPAFPLEFQSLGKQPRSFTFKLTRCVVVHGGVDIAAHSFLATGWVASTSAFLQRLGTAVASQIVVGKN